MVFNPDKHRKTKQRIAELATTKKKVWSIDKPKHGDFIRAWGTKLTDLDLVNIFVQRNGAGKEVEWLIQGKDEDEENKILDAIGLKNIKSAFVIPCFIRSNKNKFIWLGKQAGPKAAHEYPTHVQIREIIPVLQKKWQKVYFDNDAKEYVMEDPRVSQESMKQPDWPDEKTMKHEIAKALEERMIETSNHEIIKRTTGEII